MSIDQLVIQISELIIPALPYLIKGIKIGGKKAAEKIGEMSANQSVLLAEKLWKLINKKGKPSRKMSFASEELAETPKDKSLRKIMKDEIKEILKSDPSLVKEISALLENDTPEQAIHAVKNINTKITQSTDRNSKQKITARENKGLVINQQVKK